MPFDDDDTDDQSPLGPLLPPEDRIWRHPSEVSPRDSGARADEPALTTVTFSPARNRGNLALAGFFGAVLVFGCWALIGDLTPNLGGTALSTAPTAAALVPIVTPTSVRLGSVREVATEVGPAVARLEDADGIVGSAIVIRGDGYLLTTAHLVDTDTPLTVVFADGRSLPAEIVGTDDDTDVAVVKVAGADMPTAAIGSAADVSVGQSLVSISSSTSTARRPVIRMAVVRGLGRQVTRGGRASLKDMIETDVPTVAGSSGGALLDAGGSVIGLATTAGTSSNSPASTFVTPIDVAQSVASDIITTGHALHTWLGVQGTDLGDDAATMLGVDGGALVRTVTAHSPAATVGLMAGDVIVAVDTTAIRSMSALVVALRAHHPGDRVSLTYYRGQSRRSVSVTLVDRPDK